MRRSGSIDFSSAVSMIARRSSATVMSGFSASSFAARLTTCGAAMLVPLIGIVSPPGTKLGTS
jgi:hypothetical protein